MARGLHRIKGMTYRVNFGSDAYTVRDSYDQARRDIEMLARLFPTCDMKIETWDGARWLDIGKRAGRPHLTHTEVNHVL